MAKSKILGKAGDQNYYMSDCPFSLPKENLKMFTTLLKAADHDPFASYSQFTQYHKK